MWCCLEFGDVGENKKALLISVDLTLTHFLDHSSLHDLEDFFILEKLNNKRFGFEQVFLNNYVNIEEI